MNTQNVTLATVAGNRKQFPETTLPEIAFVGKSNVGKSSLINALVGRRTLARTSSAPGKTRTINFYNVDDTLYFVDLPGYGYAKVSQEERRRWGVIIEDYLKNRTSLQKILLLIDIRHEPGEGDRTMYEWLRYYQVPTVIVATKSDKLGRNQIAHSLSVIRKELQPEPGTPIVAFSSMTGAGREELWKLIGPQ
jgi:GTP-binding protein